MSAKLHVLRIFGLACVSYEEMEFLVFGVTSAGDLWPFEGIRKQHVAWIFDHKLCNFRLNSGCPPIHERANI